jgi:MOSC domain-containing protein YiiM
VTAEIVSVNVGRKRLVMTPEGRTVSTAIWKTPVEGRLAVRGVNVEGDDQADRSVHGGPDKAIYSYAIEDHEWWGPDFVPGNFGENLTVRGLDVTNARVGERWRAGSTLLEVSQPRIPCFKLGLRMGDPRFVKRFAQADRPGAYLRIVEEGDIGAGDPVEIVSRPDHGVTILHIFSAYLHDHGLAERLLAAPQLSGDWRQWAEAAVAKSHAAQ